MSAEMCAAVLELFGYDSERKFCKLSRHFPSVRSDLSEMLLDVVTVSVQLSTFGNTNRIQTGTGPVNWWSANTNRGIQTGTGPGIQTGTGPVNWWSATW
jgi:hypothetical protein